MTKIAKFFFVASFALSLIHVESIEWYEEGEDGFTEKDLLRFVETHGVEQLSPRFKRRYLFNDDNNDGYQSQDTSQQTSPVRKVKQWTKGPTPSPALRKKLAEHKPSGIPIQKPPKTPTAATTVPNPPNTDSQENHIMSFMSEEMTLEQSPQVQLKPERMQAAVKPSPQEWIFGRNSEDKLNLISWLIDGCFFYSNVSDDSAVKRLLGTGKYEDCNNSKDFSKSKKEAAPEFQTFDGFFNNPFKVDLGAVDTPLLRKVPPVYEDGSYEPVKGNRINPFKASELMTRTPACGTDDGKTVACGSKTGKSAFLVFFGQQVVEEVLDAQRPGCPPEYFNIDIPEGHEFRKENGLKQMPFLRSRWAQSTGHSPGNPRQQLNEITPWIDGGLIYGTAKGWADVLRTDPQNMTTVPHGFLASYEGKGYFPAKNDLRLPLANPPPPANHSRWKEIHETANVDRFFMLGNPRGNENAFLLSFGVILFRWHNHFAKYLHDSRPDWSGERVFQEARKWVIGTYQSIVMYNWLPEWLGEDLSQYKGYDPTIDPQIEQFFQTAAMRFGHTLVTPGAYMRDYACGKCKPVPFPGLGKPHKGKGPGEGAVRTCNIFWRPQEPLNMTFKTNDPDCKDLPEDQKFADVDRLLMGMASQKAEREDNMIVEDLRGRVFGPLEFSRRDLMAVNIQRGRDHGTPDYNTAREAFGLPRIRSVDDYITKTGTVTPKEIVEKMEEIHKNKKRKDKSKFDWDNIDVWTGGILETSYRPGPLFRTIIKDQFERIRNADRFWFENTKWKKRRFSEVQIQRIKTLDVFDLVVSVTKMKAEDIQANPFRVPDSTFREQSPNCSQAEEWQEGSCETFENGFSVKNESCWHFPQLDSDAVLVEQCTKLGEYDYFDGSESTFIITYLGVGLIVLGIGAMVPLIASFRMKEKKDKLKKRDKQLRKSLRRAGIEGSQPFAAREWMGTKAGTRSVALLFTESGVLQVRSHKGELLRQIDLGSRETIDLVLPSDGKHIIIKNPKEYDAVFFFEGKYFCNAYVDILTNKFGDKVEILDQSQSLSGALSSTVTKEKRLAKLEKFFKVVFGQAFAIDQPKGESELIDPELIREVINTELTQAEFADALGMKSESQFVEKMFDLIDRDKNRYISFREFLDMLIIFAKGTAEDKARLMFEMYDISRTGYLTTSEFQCMIRSMMEAANADIKDKELEQVTKEMMDGIGLKRDSKVSLKEFQTLMCSYSETLGCAQLHFTGVNVPQSQQTQGTTSGQGTPKQKSRNEMARTTMISFYGDVPTQDPGKATPEVSVSRDKEIGKESEVTLSGPEERQGQIAKWIELYRLQIFWGTMYTLVLVAIFVERAYVYTIEKEHGGLRQIAGYGVTVTRGAASAMMFTYATLLLTMCRNIITRLRETFLHRFIPFDSFVLFHKYVAILGLIFTVMHIIGHGFNFYHISTQTPSDLACLFRDYFRPTHVIPKFHYWAFQTITGLTGVLLVFLGALIYAFSTNFARTHAFRMFWITHASYPLWYILMLLHGSGRLVQEPLFFNFLVGPLVIFVLDRIVSSSRKKVEIPVIRAELLPSNVTKLEFAKPSGFEYKSGQWVRIATAALNSNEFHPFTLSSAPHESTLTLHIRAVGPFTANIRRIYEKNLPKIYLDGPYGEGHQDWWRYEVSVLVGGGIGVTPFASILKDVASTAHPRHCKKIYFLWVTRTQKQFEWLVDIIREIEDNKLISVHVFITQMYHKFDLRTVLLYIFERHFQRINNRSLFTGLKSVTHFGRPNFTSFFRSLRTIHRHVSKFGVFSCGPFPMTKTVDEACIEVSNLDDERGAVFQHHFENF